MRVPKLRDAAGWWRTTSLSVKLVLLSAGATALVVAASFVALRARVESNIRRQFVAELEASQSDLHRLQDRNLSMLLETSSLVSTSPTLRAALQTWRFEANAGVPSRTDLLATIQREVEVIFADLNHELLAVTDEAGNVLAAAGRPGAERLRGNLFQLPAVRHALIADTVTADSSFGVLQQRVDGSIAPLQVGCVAIVVGGYPIGVLVLAERLERLMPELTAAPATQAIVTVGDDVLVSTTGLAAVGSKWRPGRAIATRIWHASLAGEDYVAASLSLGLAENGQQATMHLLRSPSAALRPTTRALGRSFLLFGVLAALFAGAGAALVSRASLRPLGRFVAFMRIGARTGAHARYPEAVAPAEISTLTDAYNRLIDSLSRQHEQLQHRTVELAATNEALRQEVQERERAEQALRESEEQLRQSQKLEALGTLAGGVAHDFNNLLSVIMGYTQLCVEDLPADHASRADMTEVLQASKRAHGLVRQLLAFSRKQVLQPQILDLNHVVGGLKSLLQPLIGEDVELRFQLAPHIGRIMADPGQIEQVLMNLAVNARDAMPTGGTLTIETSNQELESRYAAKPDAIAGGPVVMVAITDTGTGMDAATRERIFEPFFTTKPPGKGTGLGLSTVYGIVKQSGGSITVYSEPGRGCTFRLYFPVVTDARTAPPSSNGNTIEAAGNETVLVAEDDAQVRAMVRRCLVSRGYTVLEASHGQEALEVAAAHSGPIDLLLTDVIMPTLSGRELAERIVAQRPAIRVLFMSGHSDEAVRRHDVLTAGSAFVEKPVLPAELGRRVRWVLDADTAVSNA